MNGSSRAAAVGEQAARFREMKAASVGARGEQHVPRHPQIGPLRSKVERSGAEAVASEQKPDAADLSSSRPSPRRAATRRTC